MKIRLLVLTISALLLSTGIFGQSTSPALGSAAAATSGISANEAPNEDKEYVALPVDPHFVKAGDELAGESSSRRNEIPSTAKVGPCEEPARLFSPRDYNGPFQRFAAWFSRKPEMTTVPQHRKIGQICSLDVGEKFHLFYKTTVDPVTFAGAGIAAGYAQLVNEDREWGQGAEGYGMRFGAAYLDRVSRNFFKTFAYPTLFHQDPRYFRRGHGSAGSRFGHAFAHTFVTRSDEGTPAPNLSLWAATVSTKALANLYHPGNERGLAPTATRVGESFGVGMGFDVLREFWPEVVRTLHLPFKQRTVVPEGSARTP